MISLAVLFVSRYPIILCALYIFAIPSFVHISRTTSLVLSAKLFNLFSTSWPTHRQFYHRCKSEYKKFQQIFRLFLKLLFLNCGRLNLLTNLYPRSKYEPLLTNSTSGFGPHTRYLVEITTYTIGRGVLDMSAREDKTAAVQALLAIPELRRELGRVLNFNQWINGRQHMQDHIEFGHPIKF